MEQKRNIPATFFWEPVLKKSAFETQSFKPVFCLPSNLRSSKFEKPRFFIRPDHKESLKASFVGFLADSAILAARPPV